MNHDGHLITTQALALNFAPSSYTTLRDTISHRSEQTKHQINLTRTQILRTEQQISIASAQNIFANHYKHVEEFEKYLLARKARDDARVERVRRVYHEKKSSLRDLVQPEYAINPSYLRASYRQIFPDSKSGGFAISPSYIEDMEGFVKKIASLFEEFSTPSPNMWSKAIIAMHDLIENYAELKFVEIYGGASTSFTYQDETRDIFCGDASFMVMRAMNIVEAQIDALQFDVSFDVSEAVRRFTSIDRTSLPAIPVDTLEGCPIDAEQMRQALK